MRSAALFALSVGLCCASGAQVAMALTPKEELGKLIFFDATLSRNANQSCASCHGPAAGWVGPDTPINAAGSVYEGSVPGAFGDRKPPSAAYATQSPVLKVDAKGVFSGGSFWDGRATGEILKSPAAEQAKGPFLNPVEHALPDAAALVNKVCASTYQGLFKQVWGQGACDPAKVELAYDNIGRAVAAYEDSPEVNAFSSKLDAFRKGNAKLSKEEQRGWVLFRGKGKCANCHSAEGKRPLFTDYTFDNLGFPQNPENPAGKAPTYIDKGLGGFLETRADYRGRAGAQLGKHKVPTLRNVAKGACEAAPADSGCITKAYGHNGYFKSLASLVHFYNTRDLKPRCAGSLKEAEALAANCWPAPEVPENLNTAELGNLGLTAKEESAIVAFMKTLSDGYTP